jgi:hypothetical protein
MRCEVREENERRERIAAVAQLMATQSDCIARTREVEEKKEAAIAVLQTANSEMCAQRDKFAADLRQIQSEADGLRAQIANLHIALENSSVDSKAAEELSSVKGELEAMRSTVRSYEMLKVKSMV